MTPTGYYFAHELAFKFGGKDEDHQNFMEQLSSTSFNQNLGGNRSVIQLEDDKIALRFTYLKKYKERYDAFLMNQKKKTQKSETGHSLVAA